MGYYAKTLTPLSESWRIRTSSFLLYDPATIPAVASIFLLLFFESQIEEFKIETRWWNEIWAWKSSPTQYVISLSHLHKHTLFLFLSFGIYSFFLCFYEPFSFAYIILLSYGVSTGWAGHRFHFLTHFSFVTSFAPACSLYFTFCFFFTRSFHWAHWTRWLLIQ